MNPIHQYLKKNLANNLEIALTSVLSPKMTKNYAEKCVEELEVGYGWSDTDFAENKIMMNNALSNAATSLEINWGTISEIALNVGYACVEAAMESVK